MNYEKKILNYEDLEAYQHLCNLHLEVSELTFWFPKFEMHEIGFDLRKSSSSAPASIAIGLSNKNVKHNVERINSALGGVRQTKHYLNIAHRKSYIDKSVYSELVSKYNDCERLLIELEKSQKIRKTRNNPFTKNQYPDAFRT